MDIIQLYSDYSVNFLTEGHKHCRPGWVNTECPFCTGNPGYHLGFNLNGLFYVCWRRGWHPVVASLSLLLNLPETQVKSLIRKYGLLIPRVKPEEGAHVRLNNKLHKFPSHTTPLASNHRKYLEGRNFDPDLIERTWQVVGTGPVSTLDNLNYRHRIVIPFIWNNRQVSFDSRDITGKAMNKYQACPLNRELIPHKSILYGRQDKWTDKGILVEGPTDVWRFGSSSFATSGIKYTPKQVREMARIFKRIAVCCDDDPQALIQANKIVAELKFRGVDAFRVDIEGDPGSMPQDEADYLVKQLIK